MARKLTAIPVVRELRRRRKHPKGSFQRKQAAKLLQMYGRGKPKSATMAVSRMSRAG